MKVNFSLILVIFVFLSFFLGKVNAQVKLSPIFSNNMVLQQRSDAPIWGQATPNKEVKIITSWDKKEYKSVADAAGKWMIKVKTPSAGGPYEITISEKRQIKLKNVLIGEVWICSGQSNMEMPLAGWGKVDNYEKEIAEAKYPNIRLLQVEKAMSLTPLSDIKVMRGSWLECSPNVIPEFSATAYFFARNLYKSLNIPIGVIHTSWGGTPAESWTSSQSLQEMPEYREVVEEIKKVPQDAKEKKALFEKKQNEWNLDILSKDFGYENGVPKANGIDYNDSDWKKAVLPGAWELNGLPGFDGYVWYRKVIEIPANWDRKQLTLRLGVIDDNEVTYFNGTEVGKTTGPSKERKYVLPAHLVKKGKAVIAVRVSDTGGDGGFMGSGENMYLALGQNSQKMSLSGEWKYKEAINLADVKALPQYYTDSPHNPTSLYNAMIHPIVPYAIKGAIWYQGESNDARAYEYRTLFPLMINDWRTQWGYSFPFYFVQLANFRQIENSPAESNWAELREAQLGTLHLENTGMAVSIDIGDANDIHPKNKQDVGNRLALAARAKTYGENIPYSGPIYQSYKIEGNKIRISFNHVDGGLKIKDGTALKGFSIAGPDRKFYWADATINGNDVIVHAPNVSFPIAVRYAWAVNPVCNLYNGAGLPASPFRTDDWAGLTFKR